MKISPTDTTYFPAHSRAVYAAKLLALVACLAFVCSSRASAQLFSSGDLVVVTYGNTATPSADNYVNGVPTPTVGASYADGVPTPISLEEFTTAGQFVLTDTLATTDNGANLGLVGEYGSSSEANIQLSGDDRYLTIAGYGATASFGNIGAPSGGYSNANGVALAQSTSANVPRVFAVIGSNGVANSSTVMNDIYSTNNPRSFYTANGSVLYLSGQGSSTADQGIFRTTAGTNTVSGGTAPTPIYTAFDTRVIQGYGSNLYYSQDKKNKSTGVFMYTGFPTTATTATQIISGNNGLSGGSLVNYSPDDFFFANSTVMYVADTGIPKSGGTGDGGIQKWVFSGASWHLAYTLTDSSFVSPSQATSASHGETGFESVTGEVIGGNVSLFAVSYTAGDADPDGLYAISDVLSATSGTGETFDELQASTSDMVYKSVSFTPTTVPEPSMYAAILGVIALGFAAFCRRFCSASLVAPIGR